MSTSAFVLGGASTVRGDLDPEEPRADLDRGEPPRGPAFQEHALQDGVLGIAGRGDFAGHDEQFQKELLLRQGNGHGGDSG